MTFRNFLIGKPFHLPLRTGGTIHKYENIDFIKIYFNDMGGSSHYSVSSFMKHLTNGRNDELLNEIKEKYPEELI